MLSAGQGGHVFIRKLRPDERALGTADRIYLDRLERGNISWTGSVVVAGKEVFGASSAGFATILEAETDAIAWARRHGATDLQIEGPHS
jgi:outer membrane protein assembly factor BamB